VGSGRLGSNLYSASLIALDADSGKLKWYFQETPHDLYDYDAAAEPVLLDLDVAGAKRKVVLHAKQERICVCPGPRDGEVPAFVSLWFAELGQRHRRKWQARRPDGSE